MQCPFCHKYIPSTAQFCAYCGSHLPTQISYGLAQPINATQPLPPGKAKLNSSQGISNGAKWAFGFCSVIVGFIILALCWINISGQIARQNSTSDQGNTDNPGTVHQSITSQSRIVFASLRYGSWDIFVINADGTNETRLTKDYLNASGPTWSPDGRKIAFSSCRDGNSSIYIMNADGTNISRLTNDLADKMDKFDPAWSPDGQKIAFYSRNNVNPQVSQICVMNADGSNQTYLTNDSFSNSSPAWSPDGGKIAFSSNRNGSSIYLINVDGSNLTQLTNISGFNGDPTWSPDSQKIAFSSSINGRWNIFVINADGTNLTRLTNDSLNNLHPTWSPDGRKIAFGSTADDFKNEKICVMDADGTNKAFLTSGNDQLPNWSTLPSTPPLKKVDNLPSLSAISSSTLDPGKTAKSVDKATISPKPIIQYGQEITGTIEKGKSENRVFYGTAGDVISILIEQDGGASLQPAVQLLDPSGSRAADSSFLDWSNDYSRQVIQSYALRFSGTYTVKAYGQGNSFGGYKLTLILKPLPGSILYGESVSGRITLTTNYQDWKFNGKAGDIVTIYIGHYDDTNLNPGISLLDTGGNQIIVGEPARLGSVPRDSDYNDRAIKHYTLQFSGIYTIRVYVYSTGSLLGPTNGREGGYKLSLNLDR